MRSVRSISTAGPLAQRPPKGQAGRPSAKDQEQLKPPALADAKTRQGNLSLAVLGVPSGALAVLFGPLPARPAGRPRCSSCRGGGAPSEFYALPFPNDLRLRADGTVADDHVRPNDPSTRT
jgi:hypothetical protein